MTVIPAGSRALPISTAALFLLAAVNDVAAQDTDGDGIADVLDNCSALHNPNQRDSNGDGFGNACDMDLNNDMVVNAADLGLLRNAFFHQF